MAKPLQNRATQQEWDGPPCTSCYLQSLRRADGLHVFLPFVINVGLYETVEDDSFYTPGDRDADDERDECHWNN